MKMFSSCSSGCEECVIFYTGGCIAGHGDNDFYRITKKIAKRLIKEDKLKEDNLELLKKKFPNLDNPRNLFTILKKLIKL